VRRPQSPLSSEQTKSGDCGRRTPKRFAPARIVLAARDECDEMREAMTAFLEARGLLGRDRGDTLNGAAVMARDRDPDAPNDR